jgi:type VI secretion system protein ImpE
MTATKAEELLHSGRVEESLARVQDDVRHNAADPRVRVFLFQILCVMGQWKRALTQLDVLAGMGADHLMLARIFEPVVRAELVREQVFEGRQTPSVFGEPQPWMGLLLRANELAAQGEFAAAQRLRDQAFDEAPATPGSINDTRFAWIADADPRFGPMLEAVVNGRYLWVPFCRIKKLHLERPTDLRDLVWAPAQFVWTNGGEASGHIPARYPGTEAASDGTLRLGRKTEWSDQPGGYSLGFGQRILTTDVAEYPLLECRTMQLVVDPAKS